ncbi:MAG: hypothetical protein H6669_01085 [Ardenticatenaceae bacterium]|nr:hypothetical protein [Ardenticatenaceae bacterium]
MREQTGHSVHQGMVRLHKIYESSKDVLALIIHSRAAKYAAAVLTSPFWALVAVMHYIWMKTPSKAKPYAVGGGSLAVVTLASCTVAPAIVEEAPVTSTLIDNDSSGGTVTAVVEDRIESSENGQTVATVTPTATPTSEINYGAEGLQSFSSEQLAWITEVRELIQSNNQINAQQTETGAAYLAEGSNGQWQNVWIPSSWWINKDGYSVKDTTLTLRTDTDLPTSLQEAGLLADGQYHIDVLDSRDIVVKDQSGAIVARVIGIQAETNPTVKWAAVQYDVNGQEQVFWEGSWRNLVHLENNGLVLCDAQGFPEISVGQNVEDWYIEALIRSSEKVEGIPPNYFGFSILYHQTLLDQINLGDNFTDKSSQQIVGEKFTEVFRFMYQRGDLDAGSAKIDNTTPNNFVESIEQAQKTGTTITITIPGTKITSSSTPEMRPPVETFSLALPQLKRNENGYLWDWGDTLTAIAIDGSKMPNKPVNYIPVSTNGDEFRMFLIDRQGYLIYVHGLQEDSLDANTFFAAFSGFYDLAVTLGATNSTSELANEMSHSPLLRDMTVLDPNKVKTIMGH